jgi:cell division protein FtsL
MVPALLGLGIVTVGFATLIIRLKVIQEGYRLSTLRIETQKLVQENQRLRLQQAELSSFQRLRALAPKYGLKPPVSGQIVIVR